MNRLRGCCGVIPDRAAVRRRRIIDAARSLFVDNGFHATGVAQISKESGVAVGQIYRDFDAKEAIVAAIVEGDCACLLERETLHRAVVTADVAAIWEWLGNFVQPDEDREAMLMFAEIIAESTRNKRIAAIFVTAQGQVRDNLLVALAALAPGDHVAVRRGLLAELVMTQSLGLKQLLLIQPTVDIHRLVRMITNLVAREVDLMRAMPVDA